MLSRTAASLFWLGRYVERAEFTARLVDATLRLDALSTRPSGSAAWNSALAVLGLDQAISELGSDADNETFTRFLTIDTQHPGSVVRCLDAARDNARAVRTSLSREAWSSINRAWLLFHGKASPGDTHETLELVQQAENEARAFEGAVNRMLRNPASLFLRMGAALERADNTARLLDVKYHLLLPEGEQVGGIIDRDQWQTILHTVSAVNAYRWLYRDGLQPALVIELLTVRRELPRSLIACMEELVAHLNALGRLTGLQGPADRLARTRLAALSNADAEDMIAGGLHEYLEQFLAGLAELGGAISLQFRFH